MKKHLFSIALAGIILAMSAGSVQAKEIKPPVQMKKPAINKVVHKNPNYANHHKYIAASKKKHNNKIAFNKAKSPKYKFDNNRKYKSQKYNFTAKNKPFNKNNLTAQNKNVWQNNFQVNKTNNITKPNPPIAPQNVGKLGV